MTLLDGYNFYKKIQNTKYDKNDLETKKKLQDFRQKLGEFTDRIFKKQNGFIDVQNGKGMWQNSGSFTKYMWNRYKPFNDETSLVIYFNASTKTDEGLFISIGLIDDKISDFENENSDKIYKFLEDECKKINCKGFERKDTGWGERLFLVKNVESFELIDYNEIISELKKVYIRTLDEFYKLDFIPKTNYKNLYIKWMEDNSLTETSNKLKSYLKSIEILSTILSYDIFEIDNNEQLDELYKDLVKEQRNENSKYYNKNAPSYGKNGFYSASIKSYIDFLNELNDKNQLKLSLQNRNTEMKLNNILYGPPGTGKTYKTINKALEIIDGLVPESRTIAKKKFEEYQSQGLIEFVTFHQSYGYEEFIEGIKAELNDKEEVIYKINDGIFKKLSKRASDNYKNSVKKELKRSDKFDILWNKLQEKILDELDQKQKFMLTENVYIFEVYENKFKYKGDNWTQHYQGLNIKYENIKKLYLENVKERKEVKNVVDLESLAKQHATYNISVLNEIYELERNEVIEFNSEELKKYILIIDEINRGNISKIFGELITLIEDSKRAGNEEEIEIILPYSGKSFSVPNNLYIIGTMNTADRSIALMDTALRRRFHFEEMMPDTNLLDFEVEGINIKSMVDTINQRIEYLYDRDHMIGHAYFIDLKNNPELIKLENIFRNKVIPLLQEYFYDDWEKIQMILGDHLEQKVDDFNKFIVSKKQEEKKLFGFDHDDIEDEQIIFTINNTFTVEAYKKIKL
ncbi:McrB family protein [Aliarcobacter butzleri]|uniref:McrB family protein n=1 Tax=Aliarcobacter butzleri TaxID=28197 RepID=UPI003AF41393